MSLHSELIKTNFVKLCDLTVCTPRFLDSCMVKKIITKDASNKIENENLEYSKNREFYNCIMNIDSEQMIKLIKIMKNDETRQPSQVINILANNNNASPSDTKIKKTIEEDIKENPEAPVPAPEYGNWADVHLAAKNGATDTVKLLLESGAQINSVDEENRTPLHWAARNGHNETVKLLINHGAEVNAVAKSNLTPLDLASQYGRYETVKILLDKKARVNGTGKYIWTPLYLAARNGYYRISKLLIEKDAQVNAISKNNSTALHAASKHRHYEIVKLLVENGANVNVIDKDKYTPLLFVVQSEQLEIVQYFIQKGADVCAKNKDGTILHYAADTNNPELLRLILENIKKNSGNSEKMYPFINAKDGDGDTPLMWVAQSGKIAAAKVLLEYGVDISIENKKGRTAYNMASERRYNELPDILEKFEEFKLK